GKENDQCAHRPDAKGARDREQETKQDSRQYDRKSDLDRDRHALHDGRKISLDQLPLEKCVEKTELVHQRTSSATNARVRASVGFTKICSGEPSSTIAP